jgi:hypothetical protein
MKILAIITIVLFAVVVVFLVYKTYRSLKPKPKLLKIPLTHNGVETGQWVECYEGDLIHQQLKKAYGIIPKTIETEPVK